jgi:hypothetical protein
MHDVAPTSRQDEAKKHRGNKRGDVHDMGLHTPYSASGETFPIFRKASCACGGGCPACQTKSDDLKVSQPNDPAEIEADAIADRVMRMPVGGADGFGHGQGSEARPLRESRSGPSPVNADSATIHRKCDACEDDDEMSVQRKVIPTGGDSNLAQNPTHVRDAVSGGGRALDLQTRGFFEQRMGYDLSAVRLHTGDAAAESARKINAQAYTLGSDIVFGSGEYAPHSDSGRHLLAHELAHVVQDSGRKGNSIHRKLTVDEKASDKGSNAILTIEPLVKSLCPDFEIDAKSGVVKPKAGTDAAKLNFDAVAKGKKPVGCCCLSTMTAAPDAWTIVVSINRAPTTNSGSREVRMTPTSGASAPELRYWTGGKVEKTQVIPPEEGLGHELCGHAALMQIKAHPPPIEREVRAFSDIHDPTVRVENALATEMGLAGDRRGLAASGIHRGESLRVFTIGPFGKDADDPKPFAADIKKGPVDFLNGNEHLLMDAVGFKDKSDTVGSVSKTRADKVVAEIKKDIKKTTAKLNTTRGVSETLTRIQPATDGGAGSKSIVELRMGGFPAGLIAPIGKPPPAKPEHIDPEFPAVVTTLKKGGKATNDCHELLSNTAWP